MKYLKLYKLLTEAKNFYYKIPKDKEQLLYDFYMLQGIQSPKNYKLKASYDEAQQLITDSLKKELMSVLFFAIAAEFRHTKHESDFPYEEGNVFSPKESKVIDYFYDQYERARFGDWQYKNPKIVKKLEKRHQNDKEGYKDAYSAVQKTLNHFNMSHRAFVNLAQKAFEKLNWEEYYGGKPWTDIAKGWLMLDDAKSLKDKIIAIDHAYDLQHNNDSVFNKLVSYSKKDSQWRWIHAALEKKGRIKDMFNIYNDVSPQMRSLASYIIKDTTGNTWEQYWNNGGKKESKLDKIIKTVLIEPIRIGRFPNLSPESQIKIMYSARKMDRRTKYRLFTGMLNKSDQVWKYIIDEYPEILPKLFVSIPKKFKVKVLKKDPFMISWIMRPSSELQLTAVKSDPASVRRIHKPTKQVLEYLKSQGLEYDPDKKEFIISPKNKQKSNK